MREVLFIPSEQSLYPLTFARKGVNPEGKEVCHSMAPINLTAIYIILTTPIHASLLPSGLMPFRVEGQDEGA